MTQFQKLPSANPLASPQANPGSNATGAGGAAQNIVGGAVPPTQPAVTGGTTQPAGGSPPTQVAAGGTTQPAGGPPPPPPFVQLTPEEAAQRALRRALQFRGWYPRWWILSGIFCSLLIGIWSLFTTFICKGTSSASTFCQISTGMDWQQVIGVAVIWGFFLLGWGTAFAFGVGPIEIRRSHSPTAQFFTSISQYRPVYFFLYLLGVFALGCIIIFWALNRLQPLPFALYSIVIFVANSCFLYYRHQDERRAWVIGYGIFALICMIVMFLCPVLFHVSRFQPMIFLTELAIIGIVIVLLIQSFRTGLLRQGQGTQGAQGGQTAGGLNGLNPPLSPDDALIQGLGDSTRPGAIIWALLQSLIFPNRSSASAPPKQPQAAQPVLNQQPQQAGPVLQTYTVTPTPFAMAPTLDLRQAPNLAGLPAGGGTQAQGGQAQAGGTQAVAAGGVAQSVPPAGPAPQIQIQGADDVLPGTASATPPPQGQGGPILRETPWHLTMPVQPAGGPAAGASQGGMNAPAPPNDQDDDADPAATIRVQPQSGTGTAQGGQQVFNDEDYDVDTEGNPIAP